MSTVTNTTILMDAMKTPSASSVQPCGTPAGTLRNNRGLGKFLLLSLVTLGLYSFFFYSGIGKDLNRIASPHDGKKTMPYLPAFLLGLVTFGIVPLIWFHRLSGRIGDEQQRRGLQKTMSAGTFWCWNILGLFIFIGPLVYISRLCKAMNALADRCSL